MTTGLQRTHVRHHRLRTLPRPTQLIAVLRMVSARLPVAASPGRLPAPRAAHDIRRGTRAAAPSGVSARDLHDGAVLGGIFPPRL